MSAMWALPGPTSRLPSPYKFLGSHSGIGKTPAANTCHAAALSENRKLDSATRLTFTKHFGEPTVINQVRLSVSAKQRAEQCPQIFPESVFRLPFSTFILSAYALNRHFLGSSP